MNEFDKAYEEYYGTLGSQKDFCRIIWNAAIERGIEETMGNIDANFHTVKKTLEALKVEVGK